VRGFGFFACFYFLRRTLTRTSGANKYEYENKQAANAGSRALEAGNEAAVAVALRHAANVNDARRPVNTL